jgi:hypothetical protein
MMAGRESRSQGTSRIEGSQGNRQHKREWILSKDDEGSKFGEKKRLHVDFCLRREDKHVGSYRHAGILTKQLGRSCLVAAEFENQQGWRPDPLKDRFG